MILKFKNNIVNNIRDFIEINNIQKIYLDVDGVVFHSCQAMCDILNKAYGTNVKGSDILSWNFKEICPNLTDEEIEMLFSNSTFFQCVRFIEGAMSFLNEYQDKIVLVTKGIAENIYLKHKYFQAFDFNIPICGLPLDTSKGLINMSDGLLIDDSTKNLNESNAKYKIQFLEYNDHMNDKREWTKDWYGLKMYRW